VREPRKKISTKGGKNVERSHLTLGSGRKGQDSRRGGCKMTEKTERYQKTKDEA